jgi:outer membrane protein assembly factor BamB
MIKIKAIFCLLCFLSPVPDLKAQAKDWLGWRGPNQNGIADPSQDPPIKLGSPKWALDIQGRSHGSLVIRGEQIFFNLALQNEKVGGEMVTGQFCVCLKRSTGEMSWITELFRDGQEQKLNKKETWASTTPAVDEKHVYVNFLNGTTVSTTALDHQGRIAWQTDICEYQVHQGFAASPMLYKDLVLIAADNKLGGVVCGLDRQSGQQVWIDERAKLPNYVSPIVLPIAGKDQLILTGTDKITSYHPETGIKNWEVPGSTVECVTSVVTDGKHVFTSGGYPKNHVAAVLADGSGKVAWENPSRVYVPSMIVKDGHLYAVMDGGIAVCWNCATGEEKWKERLGGDFSASPVMVGNRIYAANEQGSLFVYEATPEKFALLEKNNIGNEIFATAAICGGEIYLRVAFYEGEVRREKIVCYHKTTD